MIAIYKKDKANLQKVKESVQNSFEEQNKDVTSESKDSEEIRKAIKKSKWLCRHCRLSYKAHHCLKGDISQCAKKTDNNCDDN